MSFLATLRSQATNLLAFRAFFPPGRIARDALRLPLDHALRGGLRPFPLIVDVNVTNRCDLACDFCYNRDNTTRRRDELTRADLVRLADEAARHGAGFFLSGGEPFLRDDLLDVLGDIRRRGLPVGLVTNATRLDDAGIAALLRVGCDAVVVSVHGAAAAHDAIVGRPGAHRRAMAAVRALAERLPPPGPIVNCVVSEAALPGLRGFLDEALAIRNAVVRLAHPSFVTPAEAERHEEAWRARLDGLPSRFLGDRRPARPAAFADVAALVGERRYRRLLSRPNLAPDEAARWYAADYTHDRRCTFVGQSLVVNADGDVFPCQYYGTPLGNVRETSLARIWTGARYRHFRAVIRAGLLPGCMRCCKL